MLQADDAHEWRPVLIDFSLAKLLMTKDDNDATKHTGEVGTTTYVAPEIVERKPYGLPSDLWSVGVVLLELVMDQAIAANKDRHAFSIIDAALGRMEDQPFPDLLRGLLQRDPKKRLSARQALQHPLLSQKFTFPYPPFRLIDIAEALPLQIPVDDDDDCENKSPNGAKKKARQLDSRRKRIEQICAGLDTMSPMTSLAAFEYSRVLEQLDDTLDDSDSQGLLHCIILAHRFFEVEVLDLESLDETEKGAFTNWSLDDYVDEESTLFVMLDYCLYPRSSCNK